MRSLTFAAAALLFLCAVCVPPPVRADGGLEVSAMEAKALHAAFDALMAEGNGDLVESTVEIARGSDSICVAFVRPGKTSSYDVDAQTFHASKSRLAYQRKPGATVMSGLDVQAIALVYDGWVSGALEGPDAATLGANAFAIGEFRLAQSYFAKSGLYVSYTPSVQAAHSKASANCASFINYRVDPVTWRIVREPSVC
jgi:hypothetical protein